MGGEDAKNLKVYIRFPEKIASAQQVKDLHPAILKVTLPRQKSARWCTVEVENSSIVKELKSVKINGKSVIVSLKKLKGKRG